jgi:phosphohistidine phosphatase SixA
MADETKPAQTPEQIAAALKEYREATDRIRVLGKYPWLAEVVNELAYGEPGGGTPAATPSGTPATAGETSAATTLPPN